MSIDYATLARTPSGALTAASKRALDAHEAEQRAHWAEQSRLSEIRRKLVRELVEAAEMLEAHDAQQGNFDAGFRPETDREEAIQEAAMEQGRKDGLAEAIEDGQYAGLDVVDARIHRVYLGLDSRLSLMELLESMRAELQAGAR